MGIKMKSPPAADQTEASQSKKIFYNSLIEFFNEVTKSLTQQLLKLCSLRSMRSLQTMRCHGKVSQWSVMGINWGRANNSVTEMWFWYWYLIGLGKHTQSQSLALPRDVRKMRGRTKWALGGFLAPWGHFGLCLAAINNCSHGDHLRPLLGLDLVFVWKQ